MPKFSANLSLLYQDIAFLDRFAAAAKDGFGALEYLGPYTEPKEKVADALKANGLKQALFNVPSGDWAGGQRGIACLPDRIAEFRAGISLALDYAKALACPQVNVISGLVPKGSDLETLEKVLVENLKYAVQRTADAGVKLLIEPINLRDIPGFFLSTTNHAERILEKVASDNLYIQYDFYHMQIMQGDLIPTFIRLKDRIAHVQIADNPGRNEPGTGEINYGFVLSELDRLGYDGWVGCEYKPKADTSEGLGWMKPYRK
ncbi:hydroxypyruvate isomerase family protein [Rhizobium hidalgonense]|uniref:Hydroxypyruvate isomerase n=1 Tax=Rhizobium hidalgonense TaxID=1538159 RepID=A0A2A6KAF8_9HYPH|nr:2-oxo-tetronate isomerase [Rhizobium hidalgonense]MDR9776919.1 hydroxypyruvate isomerase family protein [Rhizobium hidalgonense]MDR9813962.1 hydroxypyruvate isomerase family protein [Rhizobium hidalgonense]MDR9820720.1 hydroxypyruvate isomerase family protein [Rhizobium hidalgonense]PDT21409.1 hydroxypyruvate isomerase [Rhizobium hidalgonense]PON08067.1 hydroxypyruvate isomerase [Rhizobium hidalgonense]